VVRNVPHHHTGLQDPRALVGRSPAAARAQGAGAGHYQSPPKAEVQELAGVCLAGTSQESGHRICGVCPNRLVVVD